MVALTRARPSGQVARQRRSGDAVADDRPLKRDMPLVPADTIAGRALVTVIAIMTFLAALAAGIAMLTAGAANDWQSDVSREMTIQVRPIEGHDLDAATREAADIARGTPGIAAVDPYSKAESEKLLQPWLGAGLDLADLPVPRLVVVKLDPGARVDTVALRLALDDKVPGASLDDHGVWLARLATMAHATVAIGIVVFALVLVAMLLAVAFATRGAMAGNKEIIEVLHFVGAADSYISRQFQSHFPAARPARRGDRRRHGDPVLLPRRPDAGDVARQRRAASRSRPCSGRSASASPATRRSSSSSPPSPC